jgi:uncharacterized membrane protein YkvI
MKLIVFVVIVTFIAIVFWRFKRKYLTPETEKPAKANRSRSVGFLWQTFVVSLVVQAVFNGLAFHYNVFGIWTKLTGDIDRAHPWVTSVVIINGMLFLAAFLASLHKKDTESEDPSPTHKAAKWITRIAVMIVIAFIWSAMTTEPSTQIYSPTKLMCKAGEWSEPYVLTTNNICWETTEDVYRVRVNQDPKTVYGTDNGGRLGIPPEPRVRIVEFMSPKKTMTVTIRKK